MKTFTIDGFASGCKAAMEKEDNRTLAAKHCLEQTLWDNEPEAIIEVLQAAIPPAGSFGEMIVQASQELTMLFARVPPRFQSGIHNHTIFACIGQLRGEEVNTIFEPVEMGKGLQATHTLTARTGEVVDLPADVIHCIENPREDYSLSLHIYGGDFGALMDKRRLWSATGYEKRPFNFQDLLAESIQTMKKSGNNKGLVAIVEAIPAAKELVESL